MADAHNQHHHLQAHHGLPEPIPVLLLTGFLGAGKTSLLNALLRDAAQNGGMLSNTLVLMNEFGEIGLDHHLIEAHQPDMIVLQGGCICCTIGNDLLISLEKLLRDRDNHRIPPFSRLIIETTGLADPAPIIGAIIGHPYLSLRYQFSGVITVIDAVHGLETIARVPEAYRQAAVAERLVISKVELLETEAARIQLRKQLADLNPTATIVTRAEALADIEALIPKGMFDLAKKPEEVKRWLNVESLFAAHNDAHHHHLHEHKGHGEHHSHDHHHDLNRHGENIRAFAFRSDEPVSEASLAIFQQALRMLHGKKLLRMKALVLMKEQPEKPLVLHAVQTIFHQSERLPAWPQGLRETQMVFIVQDMEEGIIAGLWQALQKSH